MVCKECGSVDFEVKEKGVHTGLYCKHCDSWQKWVSKPQLAALSQLTNSNVSDSGLPSELTPIQEEVVRTVIKERKRQNKKWGFPQKNSLPEWGIILGEEVGEVMTELNDVYFRGKETNDLKKEIVEVIAVAFSILEHMEEDAVQEQKAVS